MKKLLVTLLFATALFAKDAPKYEQRYVEHEAQVWKERFRMPALTTIIHVVDKDELAAVSIKLMGTAETLAISQLTEHTDEIWVLRRDQFTHGHDISKYEYDGKSYQREAIIHELMHLVWQYSPDEEYGVQMIAHLLAR